MSPEPFDSRAEDLPAKRWEKGDGDENGVLCKNNFRTKGVTYYTLPSDP